MAEKKFDIESILANSKFIAIGENSKLGYLSKIINEGDESDKLFNPGRACRLSYVLFNICLSKISKTQIAGVLPDEVITKLQEVYYLIRPLEINNKKHLQEFIDVWGIDGIDASLIYNFYLAAIGLISKNSIKVRVDLKSFSQPNIPEVLNWKNRVIEKSFLSIIYLIRKNNGLSEIKEAMGLIDKLRVEQKDFEENYLAKIEKDKKAEEAYELLGYYHLAKIISETAVYLTEGFKYKLNLQNEITRHAKHAREAFSEHSRWYSISFLIERTCIEIQRNSIWFNTASLGSNIGELCKKLVANDKIDLLPSQQQALKLSVLDPASSATIVQMPTSAGKTLLAEFSILQMKALNKDAKIVYLVPTRALVNQVVTDLRSDFEGLGLSIEKTSKVNEIDPLEEMLLKQEIDILVSTPEKFDLLIRRKHHSVNDISFIVIDEAHNIREGDRGAKLELLLTIIKREKPNARFLVLSPFLPKAEVLREWLANGKNAIKPIEVDWKPSEKVFMGLKEDKKNDFSIQVLPSPYSFFKNKAKEDIPIISDFNITSTAKKERLFDATAKHFGKSNRILFLCWGKKTADSKAKHLAEYIVETKKSELKTLISKFIDEEVGEKTTLSEVIEKGIAVHHAGLTEDSKILVEHLIRKNEIDFICATTTIAQGINFPISVIYIDDTRKGRDGRLSSNEFMNIAGRAGRTMIDNFGKVIFPFNSDTNIQYAKNLISSQALEVTSALTELILNAEEIITAFSTEGATQKRAQLFDQNKSLSVLVQYLIHLLNVSDEDEYAVELDDLFKDSFGYFMLSETGKAKFIRICTALYADLEKRKGGILKFADKTGFSVPSILKIMQAKKDIPEMRSEESWNPKYLFDADYNYLAQKIEVIGALREAKLGTDSDASPFNAKKVAEVLIGWVNGDNISQLSKVHPFFKGQTQENRINEFVSYLTDTTFKSSWGLSALEGIVRGNDTDIADNTHIPSMLYYGVNSQISVALRMVGIPRMLANSMSPAFTDTQIGSISDLRKKVNSLSNKDWEDFIPKKSKLNGEEWKTVTNILLSNQ